MKQTKTKSKLFTNLEYNELQLRLKGKKKNYSIWSNRLKPKLKELITLNIDKIKELLNDGGAKTLKP